MRSMNRFSRMEQETRHNHGIRPYAYDSRKKSLNESYDDYDEDAEEMTFEDCLEEACDTISYDYGIELSYEIIKEWKEWSLQFQFHGSDVEIRMTRDSRNSMVSNYTARYFIDGSYETRKEFHVNDDENETGYVSELAVQHIQVLLLKP